MNTRADPLIWNIEAWKRPTGALLVMTLALNVLGLTIPIAGSQIFGRIIPNPQSATLTVLVIGVAMLGAMEGLLRYGRMIVLTRSGANFAGLMTYRLLTHVLASEPADGHLASSRSVEYLGAIQQLKEKYNGQIVVSVVELMFLPLIVGVIFIISWMAGLFVLLGLAAFAALTLRDATEMKRLVDRNTADSEARYDFLFAMLSGMHAIKSMGIEDHILRRFESFQSRIAADNHELAIVTGRLLNSTPIASQILTAAMLTFGAISVGYGHTTMGGVSALVLLSGRVTAPLQRAIFILVQMRDIEAAQVKLDAVLAQPRIAEPVETLDIVNEGRLSADGLAFRDPKGSLLFEDVGLSLQPGEIVALSGPSERANSLFLQLLAGVHKPAAGEIRLNGTPPTHYPQKLLNRCVGYVPTAGILFRGTIRDNITRFGEVSVDEAMDVAAVLEIDALIKELPNGLDTELAGSASETIPPGLCQQLAILRAVATRPKLILLDNADRGLDREGYAKLHRFIGKIHGQATFVIASDDANLLSFATKRVMLDRTGLRPVDGFAVQSRTSYRDLKI
ncbi:ATP-binding cassette domain-containing protein [Mangrovicella endophytica]|uniref:ATP-binding cassette domain-containing protein n=1 Tax=Mangrovicella endophytica TaxID=2066697 RepID=UPI000C9E6F5D|nr:ATP-binding cassette domain-containing protein [Mangrovicella endophytica]